MVEGDTSSSPLSVALLSPAAKQPAKSQLAALCRLQGGNDSTNEKTKDLPETFSGFLCWPSAPFLLSRPLQIEAHDEVEYPYG